MGYENIGDGTVPYMSATMIKSLESIGTDKNGNERLLKVNTDHGGTVQVSKALDYIISVFNDVDTVESDPVTNRRYLTLLFQCPVEVTIEKDGETLSSGDSSIKTSFGQIDFAGENMDVKSVYLEDGVYSVKINGTDTGVMDLTLRWFNESNEEESEKKFLQIPVTANTLMYMDTIKDGTSELKVDTDGDGTIDDTWYSAVGDVGYRVIKDQNNEAQANAGERKDSGSKAQPVSVSKKSATKATSTGDKNYAVLWIVISAAAVVAMITVGVVYTRKRKSE